MAALQSWNAYLLQSIRDLAKNWEVYVASHLEEYLEELDEIFISFDEGKTTLNFAEAAIHIEESACLYSKKVECLYSLVYRALDSISKKKLYEQPASVGAHSVAKDENNNEEEFMDLDDIGDDKKMNVDMKDQNSNPVNILPLMPMALVPPEEWERRTNPLCSRKGEILASRKDFRMNSCIPVSYGLFLLDLAIMSPMQFKHSTPIAEDGVIWQAAAMNDDFVPLPLNDHHEDEDMENILDLWHDLDPFESSLEDKPFKKGNYSLPRGVTDVSSNKRERKLPCELQDFSCKLQDFSKCFSSTMKEEIFDIHGYGDRLVSQFNNVGDWRTFASLMAHNEPFEVCRYTCWRLCSW